MMYEKVDRWDCSRPRLDSDWPRVFHVEVMGPVAVVVCVAPWWVWMEVLN